MSTPHEKYMAAVRKESLIRYSTVLRMDGVVKAFEAVCLVQDHAGQVELRDQYHNLADILFDCLERQQAILHKSITNPDGEY